MGSTGEGRACVLIASKTEVQGIYGLDLAFRLEGFIVAVNPRLQYHSVPSVSDSRSSVHTRPTTSRTT